MRALLVLAGLSPLLAAGLRGLGLGAWTAGLELWFGFQCHARLDRSLALLGAELPVCARCLGIYLGLALGALVGRPRLSRRWLWGWVLAALAALTLDVLSENLGLRPPLAGLRLALGGLFAYPLALVLAGLGRARS